MVVRGININGERDDTTNPPKKVSTRKHSFEYGLDNQAEIQPYTLVNNKHEPEAPENNVPPLLAKTCCIYWINLMYLLIISKETDTIIKD